MSDSSSHGGRVLLGREREQYVNCLTFEAVPSKQRPFYVTRVNQFIRATGGRDPGSLDEREIGDILASFGRRERLLDWQFAQLVDAVRVYLVGYLKLRAAGRVDWSYWKGSARTLEPDHASTARESRPEELVRRKVRQGTGPLAEIRQQHEDLIVRFVTEIRARGYAYRTEQVYEQWVCRYIAFCGGAAPDASGAEAVTGFLNELVVSGNVSASTQNQALNALVFLYKRVLSMPLGQLERFARSKRKTLVPVVHDTCRDEASARGARRLAAAARLPALRHRHAGHGGADPAGQGHRLRVRSHPRLPGEGQEGPDRAVAGAARRGLAGAGGGSGRAAPAGSRGGVRRGAVARGAGEEVPERRPRARSGSSSTRPVGCRSISARARSRRHHLHESGLQRAVKRAAACSGITKRVSCHTFRHCFATHLLETSARHPHRAGTARPCGRGDDHDLHPRPQPPGHHRVQSARHVSRSCPRGRLTRACRAPERRARFRRRRSARRPWPGRAARSARRSFACGC